jgi:hypothetical protein
MKNIPDFETIFNNPPAEKKTNRLDSRLIKIIKRIRRMDRRSPNTLFLNVCNNIGLEKVIEHLKRSWKSMARSLS